MEYTVFSFLDNPQILTDKEINDLLTDRYSSNSFYRSKLEKKLEKKGKINLGPFTIYKGRKVHSN